MGLRLGVEYDMHTKAGDYESEGKYKHLATNAEIFFKNLFSKNKKKISEKKIKKLDNVKILKANSFELKVENFLIIKVISISIVYV